MKLWTRVVSCRNAVWEMAPATVMVSVGACGSRWHAPTSIDIDRDGTDDHSSLELLTPSVVHSSWAAPSSLEDSPPTQKAGLHIYSLY